MVKGHSGAASLLEIQDLTVSWGERKVVRSVSLAVSPGEILGVVGESGCGKSTLLSAILGLLPTADWRVCGSILFEGQELSSLSPEEMRRIRGARIGAIFQNPGESLNPTRHIETQFYEALCAHRRLTRSQARAIALQALARVHLKNGEQLLKAYPFQLSGGMNQRVAVALAMVLEPALLLADEPTSALDVTVQAAVIRELMEMRGRYGTAILLVTHNMGLLRYAADRIAVMYAGQVVEYGEKQAVLARPTHPYTRALLAAVPDFSGRLPKGIPGMPPREMKSAGCSFAARCPVAVQSCFEHGPSLKWIEPDHFCACREERVTSV